MTVYQIGNCLTTVIAEVLHVPRIAINLLWKPKMYGEMKATVVISLLTSWVDDILNYDPLCDPQASDSEEKMPRCNGITEVMCDWCGDIPKRGM